jgi:vancomycin permeability regulator SanA
MIVNPTFYKEEKPVRNHTKGQFVFKTVVFLVTVTLTPFLFSNLSLVSVPTLEAKPTIAIVFGAQTEGGKPGELLQIRLDKTIEEYNKHTFQTMLISGNNFTPDFETTVMKEYLLSHGVNEKNIVEDGKSLRTLDTCYRAKKLFNITSAYLITQSFHMARAYNLCTNQEIASIPLVAPDSTFSTSTTATIREVFSSMIAIKDTVLQTKPKYIE